MARLLNTGFELRSTSAGVESTASSSPAASISTTTFRSGSAALRIESLSSGAVKGLRFNFLAAAGNGPYFFRTYFRVNTAPSANNTIIQCNDTNAFTTQIASIELTSSRTLQLRDEDGTIGSPSSAIPANDFEHYIEFKIDRTGAAGAHIVEASLDGTIFATSSTRSLSAGILTFNIGGNLNAEAQTTGEWFFDDIAINDSAGSFENSYPGVGELIILRPDGDSGTPQWTRGGTDSGANWSQLDETTPNDATDYVSSNTLDQVDNYTLSATPSSMGSTDVIKVVTVGFRAAVDNATGADPDIELGITMGGNTDVSSAIDIANASYFTNDTAGVLVNHKLAIYDMPGSSTAITKSDLDSATIRLRQAATDTHFARVSAMWVYVEHKPASGTQFNQDASGGMTPSGTVTKEGRKVLAGTLTDSGTVSKSTAKTFAGSLSSIVGTLTKQTNKALSGALSSIVGTLQAAKISFVSLDGAITPSGTLTKLIDKILGSTLTSSGSLEKSSSKTFSGSITPAGALLKQVNKVLSGAISSIVGTLDKIKLAVVTLSGSITPSGSISKSTSKTFSGSITPSGSITKLVSKILAGILTLAGDLETDFIQGGGNTFFKDLAGELTSTGDIQKVTSKLVSGAVTSSGTLLKAITKSFFGALTSTGSIAKFVSKSFSGNLTLSGVLTTSSVFLKNLAGTLAPSGTLLKSTGKFFSGSLTSQGSISKFIDKSLSGSLSFIGGITKSISKFFSGVLSSSGLLTRIFNLPPTTVPKVYLIGERSLYENFTGEDDATVTLLGGRTLYSNLSGEKK